MATEIVPALASAENQGMSLADVAAHEAASYVRTAPHPLHVVRAVTRYEIASARTAELSLASESRTLTAIEFDLLVAAQETVRESKAALAAAGRLDLIKVS